MMLAKFLLVILMLNFYCQAQQDQFSSTVTETSATESAIEPSTPDSMFTTCDFDLEDIEQLLPYLPDICTEIYNNRSDGLYDLYLEESQNFAKFYKKLNDYELRNETLSDTNIVELSEYPFEAELRKDIYSKVDWALCVTSANSSSTDYLNCVKEKHIAMANLIPSAAK